MRGAHVRRTLVAVAVVVTALAAVRPASPPTAAAAPGDSQPIVATALKYLDTHGGQCWTFMKAVVAEATGVQIGYDYRLGFLEAGAYEVSPADAGPGDIIQVARDTNTKPWASYPGLHTAIIRTNLGGGRFDAIDSNQDWDEWVRLRDDYRPYEAAARYGLQVHIYRIPLAGAAAVGAAREWSAGEGAVVAVDSSCLNLRAAPSLNGRKLDCLPSGMTGTVVDGPASADGYTWLFVAFPGGPGWVAARWLAPAPALSPSLQAEPDPSAGADPAPAAPDAQAEAGPAEEPPRFAHVDDSPGCLRVRSGPGLGAEVLDCLESGIEVRLLPGSAADIDGYSWQQVAVDGRASGWVADRFLVR